MTLADVALFTFAASLVAAALAGWSITPLLAPFLPPRDAFLATARRMALPMAVGGTVCLSCGTVALLYWVWNPPRDVAFLLSVVAACGLVAEAVAFRLALNHARATFSSLFRLADRGPLPKEL